MENRMRNADKLKEWHTMVWSFWEEMKPTIYAPPVDECLDLAFIGIAGALGAQLREKSRYARQNKANQHNTEEDLAQCAIMLLTSVPSTFDHWKTVDTYPFTARWTIRTIAIRTGQCMSVPRYPSYILSPVAAISTIINLDAALPEELNKIRNTYKNT